MNGCTLTNGSNGTDTITNNTSVPQTGDAQNPVAEAIDFILSAISLSVLLFKRKNA